MVWRGRMVRKSQGRNWNGLPTKYCGQAFQQFREGIRIVAHAPGKLLGSQTYALLTVIPEAGLMTPPTPTSHTHSSDLHLRRWSVGAGRQS